MNIIDSFGWFEYFAEGPNADFFAPGVENVDELLVPSISIYEVFKRILHQRSETEALQAIVAMQQGRVIELDATIVLSAAKLSATLKIPMAESTILATGRTFDAIIWTQDVDFYGLDGVRYIVK
jgi:predicted nucleic acid-binding protein